MYTTALVTMNMAEETEFYALHPASKMQLFAFTWCTTEIQLGPHKAHFRYIWLHVIESEIVLLRIRFL
jgi:hypothetical protein